jgi:hypothetical protein
MSQGVTDVNLTAIKVDRNNKPVFVAADIENNPMIYFIGGGEDLSQLGKTVEFGLLHNLEPTPQRHLAVGMFLPKLN